MVKFSFLLSLRTAAGRREASARRWDRIADRQAKRKVEAQALLKLAIQVGAAEHLIDELNADVTQLSLAERNARDIAKTIRDGR